MEQEIKEALIKSGVNLEDALKRLMNNEKLLERLLIKFKADTNFQGLEKALKEKEYEGAFHCAHTLKGVAGNLGMKKLMDADIIIVEKLRNKNYEGLESDIEDLRKVYQQLMDVIQNLK